MKNKYIATARESKLTTALKVDKKMTIIN